MKKLKEASIALGLGLVSCNLYIFFSQRLFELDLLRNTHGWVDEVPVSYQYYASLSHFGVSECLAVFPAVTMIGIFLGLIASGSPLKNGLLASVGFCALLILSATTFEPINFVMFFLKSICWCVLSVAATAAGGHLRNAFTPASAH